MEHNARELAQQLNQHTEAGKHAEAFAILKNRDAQLIHDVLLYAGYAVIRHTDRDFWRLAQADVTRAVLNRSTGYGVR